MTKVWLGEPFYRHTPIAIDDHAWMHNSNIEVEVDDALLSAYHETRAAYYGVMETLTSLYEAARAKQLENR